MAAPLKRFACFRGIPQGFWVIIPMAVVVVAGCFPRTMPKGKGASGTVTQVEKDPDLGFGLISKLSAEHQKSYDRMHVPFEKAVTLAANAKPPAGFATLDEFKNAWNALRFAKIDDSTPNSYRYHFGVNIVTSAGDIPIFIVDDLAPSHIRNFIVLARKGFFDNKELKLEGGLLTFGTPVAEAPYTLHNEPPPVEPRVGGFLMLSDDKGQCAGTRFALLVGKEDKIQQRVTLMGGIPADTLPQPIQEMVDKVKATPGSVKIVRIEINESTGPLFMRDGKVDLPELDDKGRPRVSGPEQAP